MEVNIKHWYRRKSAVFWTILFPVLLIVIFALIFSNMGSSKMTLYVQNLDVEDGIPTNLSQGFLEALNRTEAFNIHKVNVTQKLDEVLRMTSNPRILIIPKGFSRDLVRALHSNGNYSAAIILRRDTSQITDPAPGVVSTVAREFSNHLLLGRPVPVALTVEEESGVKGFRFIDFFLPGVIGMSVMITGLMGSVSLNTEYRMNGVLRKLATTPLSKLDWVLGIVLYEVMVSFLSATVIIGIGYLPLSIFNVKASLNIPALLMIASGAIAFPGIGMIIARFVKDPATADAAANAVAFPMMFLSYTFFPAELYPEFLKQVAQVLPLTYFNEGLRAAMINNQPDIAFMNTVVVGVLAVAFIVVGALVTSWREE